jgi:hypothetical protein
LTSAGGGVDGGGGGGGDVDGFADEEVEENWEAEELTVPELRAALSKRRLPTSGRKMDLGTPPPPTPLLDIPSHSSHACRVVPCHVRVCRCVSLCC